MRDDLKNSDSSLTSASLCSTALRRLRHNRQVEATPQVPIQKYNAPWGLDG